MMPRLNQIFQETIELIKDMLDVTRRLQREWIRAFITAITIRRALTTFMTAHGVPGASVAIACQGWLVFSRGYGLANTTTSESVTTNHLFRIVSLSKPITSVLLSLAPASRSRR
jgi:hypothetical protein